MKSKQSLYEILVKYDSDKSMIDFCDALSKVIQTKSTESDIIKIISFASTIDTQDIEVIDKNVGIYEVIF
jgi:hypothetical protein